MNLSTVVDAIQGMPAFSILFKITILLVLGWTVQAVLRRGHPEWRILLWRVLAAGCLTVPALDLFQPFALYEVKVTAPRTAIIEMPLESAPFQPDIATQPVTPPSPFNVMSEPVETLAQSVDARSVVGSSRAWPWWVWVSVLWAVGMALCFIRLGRAWHRLYALDKTSLPASEELQSILSEVARDLSCGKTVQLRANSQINTPFLLGILRPKIYLPFLYTQPEYREDLPGILAHELTHLQNRDLAWKLVFECFFCLFWFHPLTWKIASAHDFACEEICDRAASQYVGDLQQYTKTLARAVLDSRTLIPGCAVLPFARPSNIHRRLSRLQTAITAPLSKKALVLCSLPLLMVIGGINGIVWTEGGEDALHRIDKAIEEGNRLLQHYEEYKGYQPEKTELDISEAKLCYQRAEDEFRKAENIQDTEKIHFYIKSAEFYYKVALIAAKKWRDLDEASVYTVDRIHKNVLLESATQYYNSSEESFTKANQFYDQLLQHRDQLPKSDFFDIVHGKAEILYSMRRFSDAILMESELEAASRSKDRSEQAKIYYLLGHAAWEAAKENLDYSTVKKYYDKALELDSYYPKLKEGEISCLAKMRLVNMLIFTQKNYEQATIQYEQIVKKYTQSGYEYLLFYYYGLSLDKYADTLYQGNEKQRQHAKKLYETAINIYNQAIQVRERSQYIDVHRKQMLIEILFRRGQCAFKAGKNKEAKEDLTEFLNQYQDNEVAAAYVPESQRMLEDLKNSSSNIVSSVFSIKEEIHSNFPILDTLPAKKQSEASGLLGGLRSTDYLLETKPEVVSVDFLVASQPPIDDATDRPQAIIVTGQVIDDAGNPISPAEVKAYVLTKNRKEIITNTQVNDDGTFSLSLPKPGDYILVSTPPRNYAEKTTLATIESNSRFDFKHASAPLHVQGTVIEQGTNQPIVGARVYLIPVHDPTNKGIHPNQSGIEGITDTNGEFNIPRVATGYFAFGADAKGHISLSPIDGDQTPNPYLRVMINEQTQSHSFPIHLAKGDAARIRVVDSNGNPVPQAEVNVYVEKDYFGRYEQFTDENGEYLFDTLAPGMAAALAKKESGGEKISDSFQTGSQENPTIVTITIPKPARIYGVVRDANRQPVVKQTVHILYTELQKRIMLLGRKSSIAYIQTDDKGRYLFEGLGEGEYTLAVQLENGKSGDKNRLRNRFSGWIRKVVQTKVGESIQADFDLIEEESSQPSDAITIRGKVIDTDQQPMAEATVSIALQKGENRLRKFFSQNYPTRTNSKGEFEITDFYIGDTLTFYVNWKSNSRTFEGIPSQTEPITLVVEPAGIVHGNVVDSKTGVQIAGAHAVLSAMGQYPPQTADSMVTGDFYIRDVSPQQNCSLEITAPGYLPINLSNISVKNGEITHLKFEMIEG